MLDLHPHKLTSNVVVFQTYVPASGADIDDRLRSLAVSLFSKWDDLNLNLDAQHDITTARPAISSPRQEGSRLSSWMAGSCSITLISQLSLGIFTYPPTPYRVWWHMIHWLSPEISYTLTLLLSWLDKMAHSSHGLCKYFFHKSCYCVRVGHDPRSHHLCVGSISIWLWCYLDSAPS